MIQLSRLCRTYAATPPVDAVADVTLDIAEGEFVSFVGPSGSGKSTLLNLVALLDAPTSGTYRLDGIDASELTERERAALRAATFGFVFQSFHLLDHLTALQNVELGLLYNGCPRARRSELAQAALERVGLAHRSDHPADKLSGGERQRVAVARAIVGGARVLVADEPTGNLDSANSESIVKLLADLNSAGTTIILVTHDARVAAAAGRSIEMRDGRIVSDVSAATAQANMRSDNTDRRQADKPPASRAHIRDQFREAIRTITARRKRAIAMVATVGVAVALVVATFGLSQSASAQVSDRFDARRNRELTVNVSTSGEFEGSLQRTGLPADTETRIGRLAGVEAVGVMATAESRTVRLGTKGPAEVATVIGVSPSLLDTVSADVEWVSGHSGTLGAREAVIGDIMAARLDLPAVAARPTVLVDGTPFAIVGVIDDLQRAPELLSGVVTRWSDATQVTGAANLSVVVNTAPGAARQVARQAPLAIDPVAPDRIQVDVPPDPTSLRAEIEGDVRAAMLALSAVAFLASIVGIANTASASVAERTGEMGLRRALGARPRHILGQVVLETVVTGLIGGLAGLYVGMLGILGVTIGRGWLPVLDPQLIPAALGAGAVAAITGGFAAALRASRIQPVDALRR